MVSLTEECSSIFHTKSPPKLKDPGIFSIACSIGDVDIKQALCDLGAGVSLMPLSICKKLNVGELKPTTILIQLADRTIRHPLGILEDVLIKVGKFFIPCDFVVMDMEEDSHTPIILGRPFLATAGAKIDVKGGIISLQLEDEEMDFCVPHTQPLPALKASQCQAQPAHKGENEGPLGYPLRPCSLGGNAFNAHAKREKFDGKVFEVPPPHPPRKPRPKDPDGEPQSSKEKRGRLFPAFKRKKVLARLPIFRRSRGKFTKTLPDTSQA